MAKKIQISFFILFFPFILLADNQKLKFDHISVEIGLSWGIKHGILQDHQGFMWFATRDGLSKYNGYNCTIYRSDPDDPSSLSSNYVSALYEDQSGVLWVGTIGGGLNKFDRETESFTRYTYDPNNPSGINSNTMHQIADFQYKEKHVLWIGTRNGLNKMDIKSHKFTHYPPTNKGYPYNYIEALVVDSAGMVWIGCSDGGIHKFNPETEQFTHYQHNPDNPYSLSDNRIPGLCLDRSGILWIGTTRGGLNRFDPKKEKFICFLHDRNDPRSLSANYVISIYEDRAGYFWIGTLEGGLNRFEPDRGQFTRYQHDPGDPNSISDNTVMRIYEDASGVLWVGTWGEINKIDQRKNQFEDFKPIPGNPNSLTDGYIWSVYESYDEGKKTLWIGTKTGGLTKVDRSSGEYTHYQHESNNLKSIPSKKILSLFMDRANILWVGTHSDGLIKFNPQTKQCIQYLHDRENPNSISCNIINSIFEDSHGILWIATLEGGLHKLNRKTGQFTQVGNNMATKQVYETKSGELWIATESGLKKLDRATEQFIHYWKNMDNPYEIHKVWINTIFESHRGDYDVLWLGALNGLYKFEQEIRKVRLYTVRDGLPSDVVNGILEDERGNLWLSTSTGLSRFNPKTETFRNYDVNDGLLSNEFTGACFKSRDGEMLFGSTKGLNAFYPDSLFDNSHRPRVVITDFKIFNKSVAVKHEADDQGKDIFTLAKPISMLEEIKLSYKQSVFSFEFAALDYHSPQKNQYAYIMEGVDPDWVHTDASRRFASYTNLDPGEYVFRVKGSNNDGIWNEIGTSLQVIITPPWWLSGWAYTAYSLLIVVVVVTIWRFQLRRIHLRNELKMKSFEAKQLQEVDQMKSRFFANISHEFRTPLTLIQGPIKQMFDTEADEKRREKFQTVIHYSNRLLGLINQILDLSKLESGRMSLKASHTNVTQFLCGIIQSFFSLAERKKISLEFNHPDEAITGYVDRDKLEKIVTNLLSNAFKFTPEGGRIVVTILNPPVSPLPSGSASLTGMHKGGNEGGSGDSIEITISNTGPGIPPDQLQRIFDRFYQVDHSYKKDSEGTGIGLALTKELVQACHGEIQVESELNKTTTFTVLLPIDKKNFKPEEIVEEKDIGKEKTPQKDIVALEISGIQQPASRIQDQASRIKSPLLMIVEDNLDVIRYISSFLEQDYRIISAENGEEGWKRALQKFPDLVISDVMMPVMDGFELCHKLKSDERTSHIPIILLTAKADIDSRIEGLEFGADDYISKPFDARVLQVRVNNLIEQRKKLREKFSKLIEVKPVDVTASSMDEQFLERLIEVSEKHLSESGYSTESFAREVGMSRSHLNRKLKALTDLSTHGFILNLRLKRAAQLLKKKTGNVTEIAYTVGFESPANFSRAFKNQFGQSPRDFAKEIKNQ